MCSGLRTGDSSAELGATFEPAGETVHAFPLPERLLDLAGVEPRRLERVQAVARAALTDPERLQSIGWERAFEEVQLLPGIGPGAPC